MLIRTKTFPSTNRSLVRRLSVGFLNIAIWVIASLCAIGLPSAVAGDPTTDARGHYSEGQRLFGKKDFPGAIKEFSAAEKIVPSGYNDFNLGLCYDKMGEADPAIQYYRSYLTRVPDAANKALVDASIARLDAAMKSAQAKLEAGKAEQGKADAAKADAQRRIDEAALAQRQKEEDAAKAAAMPPIAAAQGGGLVGSAGPAQQPIANAPFAGGDPQLDRVAAIDINAIRGQQPGSGLAVSSDSQAGTAPAGIPSPAQAAAQSQRDETPKPQVTPVYKKWWFWAIVIVGGIIVYDFATSDSESDTGRPINSARVNANSASAIPVLRF